MKINKLISWLVLNIVAVWILAIALLSVQNATLVSLKFLIWQSVPLSLGLLLSFGLASGIILGGAIPGLSRHRRSKKIPNRERASRSTGF